LRGASGKAKLRQQAEHHSGAAAPLPEGGNGKQSNQRGR
jgi:hypothetical protein